MNFKKIPHKTRLTLKNMGLCVLLNTLSEKEIEKYTEDELCEIGYNYCKKM